MVRNQQIDKFAMMRAAATSMSSALLLAVIGDLDSPSFTYEVRNFYG
jgi:FPC/CPF motif-containing protein YcgG